MQEKAQSQNDKDEKELSPKQEQLIIDLVSGKSIRDSAHSVGTNEATAHKWIKQPTFQKAYETAKKNSFNEKLDMLRTGI